MTTNTLQTKISTDCVKIALEEMQLEKKELVVLRKNLLEGFFCFLHSEKADSWEERKAVTSSFASVFALLDLLEA